MTFLTDVLRRIASDDCVARAVEPYSNDELRLFERWHSANPTAAICSEHPGAAQDDLQKCRDHQFERTERRPISVKATDQHSSTGRETIPHRPKRLPPTATIRDSDGSAATLRAENGIGLSSCERPLTVAGGSVIGIVDVSSAAEKTYISRKLLLRRLAFRLAGKPTGTILLACTSDGNSTTRSSPLPIDGEIGRVVKKIIRRSQTATPLTVATDCASVFEIPKPVTLCDTAWNLPQLLQFLDTFRQEYALSLIAVSADDSMQHCELLKRCDGVYIILEPGGATTSSALQVVHDLYHCGATLRGGLFVDRLAEASSWAA